MTKRVAIVDMMRECAACGAALPEGTEAYVWVGDKDPDNCPYEAWEDYFCPLCVARGLV